MNDKPLLSVVMPAIRPERWDKLYKSIGESLVSFLNFELILVTPHQLPAELQNYPNIKLVNDFGSPTRCFNIALEMAEGKLVTWGADDGLYVPGKLMKVVDRLLKCSEDTIIAMSQIEAGNVYDMEFCRINKHPPIRSEYIPDNFILFPTAVMYTKLMLSLGGMDCRWQGHAMANIDFAIRAQARGCKVEFEKDICLQLSHMMGPSGDHAPIHHSQINEDEPLFRSIYTSKDNPVTLKNYAIKLDNWKDSSPIWHWRFGNKQ